VLYGNELFNNAMKTNGYHHLEEACLSARQNMNVKEPTGDFKVYYSLPDQLRGTDLRGGDAK